ncbi:hypothetical protein Van01_54860 [Micromonospora andamanensis]|uniref:histidine kinase n=1 Tax=Micromonospora andamanensis TaxID=1287068 RepID=A0ABQ4I2Z0_9ACTN|nr:hypothetical protein Van01_54860 [Micromonospora andamanensis]
MRVWLGSTNGQSDTGPQGGLLWSFVAPAVVVAVIGLGVAFWAVTLPAGPVPVMAWLVLMVAAGACVVIVAGAAVRAGGMARSIAPNVVAVAPAAGLPVVVAQQEVYVGLARRLQGLVHREIQLLDVLEGQVEDPDLLKGLFQVDHLATRIRRYAENLAVVGGAVPRRQWSRPLPLMEVLRSAIAEVEHYARVRVVPPVEGTVRGHAGADVVHLLAELIENATAFAPPQTEVTVRARRVAAGVAVEVDDRGLGMAHAEQDRVNALLADPGRVEVADLLRDGRIGIWVVSALARRHGIAVRVQNNVYGGVQAVVILPVDLLGDRTADQPAAADAGRSSSRGGPAGISSPTVGVAVIPASALHPSPPSAGQAQGAPRGGLPARHDATTAGHMQEASGTRPALPRRERQAHLAAPLREHRSAAVNQPSGEHSPTLMADFLRGAASADAEQHSGRPGS